MKVNNGLLITGIILLIGILLMMLGSFHSPKGSNCIESQRLRIEIIDNCKYVSFKGNHELVHHGACDNPIHK